MNRTPVTAANAALVSCHSCHLLSRHGPSETTGQVACPRCRAPLHLRKPNSIARTWALILTAYMFYIPANILPITVVTSLRKVQSDTIMSGVIYFMKTGMWPIALVIFVASVFVPIMKLVTLTYLLVSIQRKSKWRPHDRTRLYRITQVVGRWSMVDIYVVTILVALVKFGAWATIKAGPGGVFFAAVVVITMFAARAFDPRLIWDSMESKNE